MQNVYIGKWSQGNRERGKATPRECYKQITTSGTWGLIPPGPSEKLWRKHFRIVCPGDLFPGSSPCWLRVAPLDVNSLVLLDLHMYQRVYVGTTAREKTLGRNREMRRHDWNWSEKVGQEDLKWPQRYLKHHCTYCFFCGGESHLYR